MSKEITPIEWDLLSTSQDPQEFLPPYERAATNTFDMPPSPESNDPVLRGGACRPNAPFVTLCHPAL